MPWVGVRFQLHMFSLRPSAVCRGPASKREKLKPGKISQMLEVPEHIPRPPYVGKGADPPWFNGIQVHSEEVISLNLKIPHPGLQYGQPTGKF